VYSFWNACCAGQLEPAKFLLEKGADVNWIPDWCDTSPLDGAIKSENKELVEWLEALMGQSGTKNGRNGVTSK